MILEPPQEPQSAETDGLSPVTLEADSQQPAQSQQPEVRGPSQLIVPPPDPKSLGWRVVASSVQGSSHEKLNLPCQDAHRWQAIGTTHGLVIAAADGRGSAPLSQIGSAVAAKVAISFIESKLDFDWSSEEDQLWKDLCLTCIRACHSAVREEADKRGHSFHDLATTLIVVLATPEIVAAVHVGDGGVVVRNSLGDLDLISPPENGEHVNETTFLTSAGAVEGARTYVWRGDVTNVGVFTDGLQMVALQYPGPVPYPPFFEPLFEFVSSIGSEENQLAIAHLDAFLRSDTVRERCDDDLTLVVAEWGH